MNPTSKPRRKDDYRIEVMDGEVLIYHPAEARVLYCNAAASLVWQLCDGETSVEEMTRLLAGAYPDAAAEIPAQVQETLETFIRLGALETQ